MVLGSSTLSNSTLRLQNSSFAAILFETSKKLVCVVRCVVVDDVTWVVRVDLVNVLTEFASGLSLNFLNLLEATTLDKGTFSLEVLGKDLGKLSADVGEDVVGGERE